MSDQPVIPTADAILGPALESMYSSRPLSFQHLNLRSGVYWHPFLGFRAQTARSLRRLAELVAANRLSTAEGDDLLQYVASEYDALPDTAPTFSVGSVTLQRTVTTVSGEVPKGTLFSRQANLTTQIPLPGAQYETLVDAHFDVGQATLGPVPVQARSANASANHPIRTDAPALQVTPASPLFDQTITVSAFDAAGGSSTPTDDYVRRFARAFWVGQYGPTDAESKYGALQATGVRNMLVYDIPGTGTSQILIADESWASSDRWASIVQQSLHDNDLIGFGCKVLVSKVRNVVISVDASVILRDKNFLNDTSSVDIAIRSAVRSYFDDRADWNVWKTNNLQGVIARAHPKIFSCSSVTVKDINGNPVSQISTPNYNTEQFHYYLASNAVTTTYSGPS